MKAHLLLALAGAGLVGGCAVRSSVSDSAPPIAADGTWKYQSALESSPASDPAEVCSRAWWLRFGDDELARLISAAAPNNLDVQVALARRDAARAGVAEAEAEWWPSLRTSAQSNLTRISSPGRVNGDSDLIVEKNPATRHSVSAELSYEVDLWGRVRANAAANRAEFRASSHDLRAARVAMSADIASQYFNVRTIDAVIALRGEHEALLRDIAHRERERLRAGVSDADSLLRAERDLLRVLDDGATLLRERATAESRLAILLGEVPMKFALAPRPQWSAPLITPPALLPAALLDARPDIAAAGERIRVASSRVGEAQAARLPQFTLTGTAGTASEALNKLVAGRGLELSFGPSLQIPIFDGGRLRAREQAAVAEARRARIEYQQTALRAFEEVENALAAITAARARESAARETLQSVGRSTSLVQQQLEVGRVSRLTLLTMQAEELAARQSVLQAESARLEAIVSLMRALGGGWCDSDGV